MASAVESLEKSVFADLGSPIVTLAICLRFGLCWTLLLLSDSTLRWHMWVIRSASLMTAEGWSLCVSLKLARNAENCISHHTP